MNKRQFNIWYWIAAFIGLMIFQYIFITAQQVAEIPYSTFESYLESGRIAEVQVSDRFIQGTLKEPLEGGQSRFITTRIDPDIAQLLREHNVVVTGQIES
ncbi:MAG TPA: ATP-dependent metallopeptidase FtsH/Yme1/Tma family protein, partial [Ferrovibrio sp.]